jgi:hypothetical protein
MVYTGQPSIQGTTWSAFHIFEFLSNDDGQCLKFSLKRDGLRHHLKRRGYNDKVIESGFSKTSEINRNDLLEYKEKNINKRVPLVLTYHPSLEKISGIVRHH